ncbi:hypothetical protein Poli38472_003430 [Pythium oligandrum]|uniref:FAD-binding FR-type domain-containing protein n=1 Tax=Pythium oligandrum TaxID=41045 RepID=A0A8K1C6T3_PYTOL|nr:hypothetical protein Poli38472_003430 [Pythium oligandrum]|eukprot:TMW57505.1 hypothetical protein Poli38472_003430 [Pythium oligandrum]
MALSPTPDVDYTNVKTPDGVSQRHPGRAPQHSLGGGLAVLFIFAAMFVFMFAQFFFFSTSYESLSPKIGAWFGVTEDGGGHGEMVIPTYFFLFALLPFVASVLVFELLRYYNVHRIASSYAIKATSALRIKPFVGGWLSPWSWGEILFLAVLLGGNVNVFYYYYNACVIFYQTSDMELNFTAYLDCWGLGLGYAAMFNIAFLFLPSTRDSAWMELLGISYANGIKYHRWVGVLTVVTSLLHTIFYYWMYIRMDMWVMMSLPCIHCDASDDGKAGWMNFLGLIALIAMLLIAATSIPYVRRHLYGVFYSVHQLFTVAVLFSVLHFNSINVAILPTFVLYLISRTTSIFNGSKPVAVKEFAVLGTNIVKITIPWVTEGSKGFSVGQFVYLNVPAISKLQWHPFTITTSPRVSPDAVTLLLKVQGKWTAQLAKYAQTCKENSVLPVMYMDGYYGASLDEYEKYSTVCLIGGGTGVTPLLAILHDMVAKLAGGETPTQKVYFIFTLRELALLEEIHPLLMRVSELDPHHKHFVVRLFLTQQPTSQQLEQHVDLDRLTGKLQATGWEYDKSVTSATPLPFSAPLRSSLIKPLLYLTTFVVVCALLAVLRYGPKIQASSAKLWPLQNFVEITLVFVIVPLVTYVFGVVEHRSQSASEASNPATGWNSASDVRMYQDLVAEHRVTIGEPPNVNNELKSVLEAHKQGAANVSTGSNSRVGVFISGPVTLKAATERSIAELGATNFGVHEEEFEL